MKKIAQMLFLTFFLMQMPVFAADSERVQIYYNNGVTYFKDKKYTSAILEFKKVLRQRPYDKTVQKAIASAYLSRADYYSETEKAYKKALNDVRSALVYLKYWDSETDEQAYLELIKKADNSYAYLTKMNMPIKTAEQIDNEARSLRAQGEFAASIYEYTRLFKSSIYGKSAYSTASDIYKSLNNEKMAITCIRSAINLNGEDGMFHFKYALILDDIGNEDAAMDEYSRALEHSKDNKELLSSLANLWRARSVQNPNDSQALINLGAVLQKQGQYDLAKAQYIKARQINPNDPVILVNLASVCTALNDYDNAIKIYDEILLKNAADLSARFYKGKLYEKKGEIGEAVKQYKEILALKKDDANAQNALNALLSNLSGEQLAGYLQKEAINNPQNYDAQFKYAYEMHKNKGYSAAIEYYKRAIAADNKHVEPFINLAQIFMNQEDYQKAGNVIRHGLAVLPDNMELKQLKDSIEKANANQIYAKGAQLYNDKDYKGALDYYLKISYETPEINTMIANCYYELKDNNNALKYYKKVLDGAPKDENALYMAATIFMDTKREEEAKAYLGRLIAINPNHIDAKNALKAIEEGQEGELLDTAISLYEKKKYEEGLDVLNKLIGKNSKNAYAYYYRGAIYEEKGNIELALSEYKKSIAADPKFSLGYYMAAVALDTKENYKEATTYYDKYIVLKEKEGTKDEFLQYAKTRTKELKDYLSQK